MEGLGISGLYETRDPGRLGIIRLRFFHDDRVYRQLGDLSAPRSAQHILYIAKVVDIPMTTPSTLLKARLTEISHIQMQLRRTLFDGRLQLVWR